MALTLDRCLQVVEHASYGSTSIPPLDLVNETVSRLSGMHPWLWTHRPPLHLGVRGPVSATTDWRFLSSTTGSDGILYYNVVTVATDNAAVNAYAHAPGDSISIQSGTGMILRDFFVAAKVPTIGGNDALALTEDASTAQTAASSPTNTALSTDVRARINSNRALVLPSDFGYGLRAYSTANTLEQSVLLTSWSQLNLLRSSQTAQPAGSYLGAIFWGQNEGPQMGAPRARLELWPYPTSEDHDLFTVSYHRQPPALSVDSKYVPIPPFMEGLFLSLLQAVAKGYEHEDEGLMQDRIDRIRVSSEYQDAIQRDGLAQPDYGALRGGGEDSAAMTYWPYPNVTVSDP